jgi:hypothetical protein
MKQSIILWAAAAIITFLAGFIQNRTSSEYPVSGTIGIEGREVSFHFRKVFRDKGDYVLLIRTDIENLKGIIKWRRRNENQAWQTDTLKYSNGNLSAAIPNQEALSEIEYRIFLNYNNREYFLPEYGIESVLFLGPVPLSINIHFYLTLFVGILLAIRAGLEYFNHKPRLRLYSIFALISFFSCAMIFAPVKKVYEMGAIGKSVPPINKIFEGWLLALIVIWIINLILVSYTKHPKKWVLIFSILTILIFLSQNFIMG